jgi:hypothetical protein
MARRYPMRIDTGTFTELVVIDNCAGESFLCKRLTTPKGGLDAHSLEHLIFCRS